MKYMCDVVVRIFFLVFGREFFTASGTEAVV